MKRLFTFSILLVTAFAFQGCIKIECGCDADRDHDHDSKPEYNQPVLFQYEYYNYAWGFRHRGFLIDEKGHVNGFDQPEKWIVTDSTGMMSKADLDYNLARCDTVCGKVDQDEMNNYFSRIRDIRLGKILNNGLFMADAGTGIFSAWYWNARAGKYENVFLISNGDVSRVNTHPDVKAIVAWLRDIGEKTNRFYWYGGE